MSYPALTAAKDHVVTTLGSELPSVMTESQVFSLAIARLFEVDANGEPTAIPLGQSGPFVVEIDSEEILCSSFANGQTGVYFDGTSDGRGYNSTTIVAHNPNAAARVISSSVQSVLSTQSGGGSFTAILTGEGNPNTSSTVPSFPGQLYIDTTDSVDDNTGVWVANDFGQSVVWSPAISNAVGYSPGAGTDDDATVFSYGIFDSQGNGIQLGNSGGPELCGDNGNVTFFITDGSPSGVVTPNNEGDIAIDISTPGLWQATGTENTDWSQIGSGGGGSPAVSSGTLGTNVTINNASTETVMTTDSLDIGDYLVTFGATILPSNANCHVGIQAIEGTATATFAGASGAIAGCFNSNLSEQSISISFVVSVTEAGTIIFQGQTYSNFSAEVEVTPSGAGLPDVFTGYTIMPVSS